MHSGATVKKTASEGTMKNKPMKDVKDALIESYEDLREFMVCHKVTVVPPRGLALFLHQGMPGWMEAWSKLEPSDKAKTVSPQPLEISPVRTGPLPPEVAAILANMALATVRRENL
jgi:hypothetical protein